MKLVFKRRSPEPEVPSRRKDKPLVFKTKKAADRPGRCMDCNRWATRVLPPKLKDQDLRFCVQTSCYTPPDGGCWKFTPASKDKTVYTEPKRRD